MLRKSTFGLVLAATVMSGGVSGIANAAGGSVELPEAAAVTTDLGGNASAVTYWTSAADGWDVVTTIDSVVADGAAAGQPKHAVVRFSAVIQPGQSQVISVPGPLGSASRELRINRLGDRIAVALVNTPAGT